MCKEEVEAAPATRGVACSLASPAAPRCRKAKAPEPEADGKPVVSEKERKAVAQAIDALDAALARARAELKAGRRSDAGPIEKARVALLKALSKSALGQELAGLQRFLPSALMEIRTGSTVAELQELFDRHARSWASARKPEAAPFWEASV